MGITTMANRETITFEIKDGGINAAGHCDVVAALQAKAHKQTQWIGGDYLSSPVWQNFRLTLSVNTDKAPADYQTLVKDYLQALLEMTVPGAQVRLISH